MISYVAYQLEELTYKLFIKAYISIRKLRQQRLQLLKCMMYNGVAVFLARMILNSTSVTAQDAGQLLAVSKCMHLCTNIFFQVSRAHVIKTFRLLGQVKQIGQVKEFFNSSTLNVVNMDIGTPCSHSMDKYLKAKDNSYLL